MRAIIYGVSGQDGAYLSQHLLELGYEVWGASRDAATTRFYRLEQIGIANRIKTVSASLNDFRSVLQSLVVSQPDEVYNLAGQSSVSLSFEQPAETMESVSFGTLNLLEAIRFLGGTIKLYNACSSECFGDIGTARATEDTPFRPRSPYAVAKAASFWTVANYREAYNMFACNGILFNHESPLREERFVTRKVIASVARILKGSKEKLRLGNIDIHRDWGWAPEYVRAMRLMMLQAVSGDFVVATGESHSLREFVECAFSAANLNWNEFVEYDSSLLRPTEIVSSHADPSKAKRLLKWHARFKMEQIVELMLEAEIGLATQSVTALSL